MARQLELFLRPHAKRVRRMRLADAGSAEVGPGLNAKFRCKRCGHTSAWQTVNATTARQGLPCPNCNRQQEGTT